MLLFISSSGGRTRATRFVGLLRLSCCVYFTYEAVMSLVIVTVVSLHSSYNGVESGCGLWFQGRCGRIIFCRHDVYCIGILNGSL